MRYYCVDFLAVIGDAAVGSVIPVPTRGGVESIELGKIEGRHVAGGAVDQKPSAGLPLPVLWRCGFLRKAVVDAESAADHEQAVGYIVSGAEREFFDAGVDEEWPNF